LTEASEASLLPDPSSDTHRPDPASPPHARDEDRSPVTGTLPEADPSRRRFFRQVAGELFNTAATVVGAASVLQRSSAEAAQSILQPERSPATPAGLSVSRGGLMPSGFRTPFRLLEDDTLVLIDQRRLPDELVEHPVRTAAEAASAIRQMVVRGAPAIGQVAALALALSADVARQSKPYARRAILWGAANALVSSRPTAVNLRWAVDRMMARYSEIGELSEDGGAIAAAMRLKAETIVFQATTDHGRLAEFGVEILPNPADRPLRPLTHCNTGPLACGQFGTALGVIQVAHHAQREMHVWVDETRPYLQGARLTAWELAQAGVPHSLIADAAAGWLMARGEVDVVLVGADRIAANGDTANKIGTYPLAVLAARHGVPFFVCAPLSSVDVATPDGGAIDIEERSGEEVLLVKGQRIAPPATPARNPAFDVTPADLISGIITEEGVLRAPYEPALQAARLRAAERWASMPALEASR
jgi:methylthioribose-1-phosphate isomerase